MTISESAVLKDAERILQSSAQGHLDNQLVVTATRSAAGRCIVLSRFGDPVWRLPDDLFPSNVYESAQKLRFNRIPKEFEFLLKFLMFRYYTYGVEGSGRPRGGTLIGFFVKVSNFLRFLSGLGVDRLDRVNTLLTSQYVEASRSEISARTGKPLTPGTLTQRFSAVETLFKLSQDTADVMPHPWPDTSACVLSGLLETEDRSAKTAVIPDTVLSSMFQNAHAWLEDAERLLELRDFAVQEKLRFTNQEPVTRRLAQRGYTGGLGGLWKDLATLLEGCMLIVLATSGIRVSEMGSLERGCAYTTIGDDGERYHWIRGKCYKTHQGDTVWLVPAIAHKAIAVAERVTEPLSKELEAKYERLLSANQDCPEADKLRRHRHGVFLVQQSNAEKSVSRMTSQTVSAGLKRFARLHGHNWRFTPHQFRRTFGVYAAHSAHGDLRYLREHFKHWGLDMTALYAMDERQDADLFDEVLAEVRSIKIEVVEHWLDQDTPLSGGLAEQVYNFRKSDEAVQTYSSRREMTENVVDHISVRSNGVAWCSADEGGCIGGQGAEITRCGDCTESVIDETKQPHWEAVYCQQLELRQMPDIGASGRHRVERDIARCEKVLTDLGADLERLKRHE